MAFFTSFQIASAFLVFAVAPGMFTLACDLEKANACIEQLRELFDGRQEGSVKLCVESLKTDSSIKRCYQMHTALCEDTRDDVIEIKEVWSNLTADISVFCEEECTDYVKIGECHRMIDFDAVGEERDSAFCSTYEESHKCLSEQMNQSTCASMGLLYDGLFSLPYYKNRYERICLTGCSNLDETLKILKECYGYLRNANESNVCPSHLQYTECLRSYRVQPCREFTALMPSLYTYDYYENQRLCQDKACFTAQSCQSNIQRQYDSALVTYNIQSDDGSRLQELCMANLVGNDHTECYYSSVDGCTGDPAHPIRQQWTELAADIDILCNTNCEGVMKAFPRCYGYLSIRHFRNESWSQFCQSHRRASECISELNCQFGADLLRKRIGVYPNMAAYIDNMCSQECDNLDETLTTIERCSSTLSALRNVKGDCSRFEVFKRCMNKDACSRAPDIISFLFPVYNQLEKTCTTTTTQPTTTTTTSTTTPSTTPTTTIPSTTTEATMTPSETRALTTEQATTDSTTYDITTVTNTSTTSRVTVPDLTTQQTNISTMRTTEVNTAPDLSPCLTEKLKHAVDNYKATTSTDEDFYLCMEIVQLAMCLTTRCQSLLLLSRCVTNLPPKMQRVLDHAIPQCRTRITKVQHELADFQMLTAPQTESQKKFFNITCTKAASMSSRVMSSSLLMSSLLVLLLMSFRVYN